MFIDPITISVVAGLASLTAGVIKKLKDVLAKGETEERKVVIKVGEKEVQLSGLDSAELVAVIDQFELAFRKLL